MIDKWFQQDLDSIFEHSNVVVFIDESMNGEFLLKNNSGIVILNAFNEVDELKTRYEIQKHSDSDTQYVIYTHTPRDNLKFIREYCEINGAIEIKYFHNYIKEKINKHMNLNLQMGEDELLAAAKVSVGKDESFWRKLATNTGEIFDLESQLLPFLHDATAYLKNYDEKTIGMFFEKINAFLGQENISKPTETLVKEVVTHMFDGLLTNTINKTLMNVYKNWLDSREYKKSFDAFLAAYQILEDIDIWKVNVSHPFYAIDLKWLEHIGSLFFEKEKLSNYMPKINQRAGNQQALHAGISFWSHIKLIIEFDDKEISHLSSMNECIVFYTQKFYKVDGAIRKIYTEFLDKKELLGPIQEYYRNLVTLFLDKWFRYFDDYQQNQTGMLQQIIDSNDAKTAIIVGDGITYELSLNVASMISKEFEFINNTILANFPSVTENNMSQIYIADGHIEKMLNKREQYLTNSNQSKDIGYVYLEDVDENTHHHYLVSQYKDIDDLGDKMNNKALKYFGDAEKFFASKIEMLLKNGYKKVYMITDHGFVLTGQLRESDKIEVSFNGKKFVDERFVLTEEKQTINQDLLYEINKDYDGYNFIYFAKSMSPFKSVGSYGFSHGGIAPQELITPYLCWENVANDSNSLSVFIANKKELSSVTGGIFRVKLETKVKKKDIFSANREITILLLVNGKIIEQLDNISINEGDIINKELRFGDNDKVDLQILDSNTKEQLDKTSVVQNKVRDLGGL